MPAIKIKLDKKTEENWQLTRSAILKWIDDGLKTLPPPKTVDEIETMAKAGCFLLRILGDSTPIKEDSVEGSLGELRARMAKELADEEQPIREKIQPKLCGEIR